MYGTRKYRSRFRKLCQSGIGVLVLATVLMVFAVRGFQNFSLYPGSDSPPLFPLFGNTSPASNSSFESGQFGLSDDSKTREVQKRGPAAGAAARDGRHSRKNGTGGEPDDFDLDEVEGHDDGFSVDRGQGVRMRKMKDPYGSYVVVEKPDPYGSSVGLDAGPGKERNASLGSEKEGNLDNSSSLSPSSVSNPQGSYIGKGALEKQGNKSSDSVANVASKDSSTGKAERESSQTIARSEDKKPLQSDAANRSCQPERYPMREKREKTAAVTLSEMDQILLENRASASCSMVPKWSSSPSDMQILEAKKQILNAPFVEKDQELYAPAFRNLSTFKRSYELMEKVLKVYIYKEGEEPIFHQPHLTGIYASEGWFMKQMEGSRRYVAGDPREAHLFYMPFSSSRLRFELPVPSTNRHRDLVNYLKKYVATIAGKYPFWNRTGGTDHFLAACHDWAPRLIEHVMGASIRALCNASLKKGFELGKDVSLPTTHVRTAEDPLRDLGGRPPNKRPLLAFFAGHMNGYLRPLLLRHWENKDPAVMISGPLPRERARKTRGSSTTTTTAYAQYMQSSRYCICPRGHEVNSPRVVEAIFYGCVPVIVADNFVPPFFEVLDWSAFSVVVAERDVPRLKEILEGIPWGRYLALQRGVRRVQRHFVWHNQPVRYDLFHMILHSVWFNRVFSSSTEMN